jgi:BASS family bile acid:Na+ symporter
MNTIWIVMPILLVLMFLLGTGLSMDAFSNVARHPRAVLVGLTGQIILLPAIAFALAWALDFSPVYFLYCCCSCGWRSGSSLPTETPKNAYISFS